MMRRFRARRSHLLIAISIVCPMAVSMASDGVTNDDLVRVYDAVEIIASIASFDMNIQIDDRNEWHCCAIIPAPSDAAPKPYIDGATGAIVQPPGSVPIGSRLVSGSLQTIDAIPGVPASPGWTYRWISAPVIGHGGSNRGMQFLLTGSGAALVNIRPKSPPQITSPTDIVEVRSFPTAWAHDIVPAITFRQLHGDQLSDPGSFDTLMANPNRFIEVGGIRCLHRGKSFDIDHWSALMVKSADPNIIAVATLLLIADMPKSDYDDLAKRSARREHSAHEPMILLGLVTALSYPETMTNTSSNPAFSSLLASIATSVSTLGDPSPLTASLVAMAQDWVVTRKTVRSEEKQ